MSFPPELRRYRLTVIAVSLLVGGAGVVALIVATLPATSTGSVIALGLYAIVVLPLATFGLFFVPRWYRRAGQVVATTSPIAGVAVLTLESSSDSDSLYATVSIPKTSTRPLKEVALLHPKWDVQSLLGSSQSVQLYVDPDGSRLVAIATDHGMLWCMPTGQILKLA